MKFILYSRSYCHLCEDLLQALRTYDVGRPYTVEVIDVDADPDLVARYDELVPVLFGQISETAAPVQLCHYFFDTVALRAFLEQ